MRTMRQTAVSVAVAVFALSTGAADIPSPLPDPDGTAPDTKKPVRVYILMGQSNMVGFGKIGPATTKGTLEHLVKQQGEYPYLVNEEGEWALRKDVWCVQSVAGKRKAGLQPGFGARGSLIGPELGFGHVVGYVHDEMVLIIKATMGNRHLGWDLLPPSSRTVPPEQHSNQFYQGWQLDVFIKKVHGVLDNLETVVPDCEGQGYEIAGFAWWQGHADQNTPGRVKKQYKMDWTRDYEKNLVHLIQDLRKEFNAPKAPFVVATIAFGGEKLSGNGLKVAEAQLAVSGEKGKYPEFKGNVKTVDARPFWRPAADSPSNKGYHYNLNAGTYMDVGHALGKAMAELEEGKE